MARLILAFLLAALIPAATAQAEDGPLPPDRYVISRDVDFFGSDRAALFDTTEAACRRACSADDLCVGYTFNSRSNACFPKSAITEREAYDGAISATRRVTSAEQQARAALRKADLAFLRPSDFDAARALADGLAARFSVDGSALDDLVQGAARAMGRGEPLRALGLIGPALAISDRADLWETYAGLALRFNGANQRQERRRYAPDAIPAAINAYLRADSPGQQATALETLARALDYRNRGQAMIPALRLAYEIQPRDDLSAALDDAIAKHGFRVVADRVESDAPAPRLCAEFSDPLAESGVDYLPFVRVDAPGIALEASGRQLCIDGLAHGQRYTVTLRSGLPSAAGEVLARDTTLRAYMRDRAPAARFPGRAYVLPRSADAALPVETVNVAELELVLRRVSDRNLVRAIQDSYFGRPLNGWEEERFATRLAQEVWRGTAEVGEALNQDVTTRLPMGDVLADLPTGIYTLSAAVPGADVYQDPAATQWFVLTDIGLSSWLGADGMTVAARSLGAAEPLGDVEFQLISRANAVLGTVTAGADGFAQFPAGLTRGTGSGAPALLVARRGEEDIAFLPLTDPAFDLSDRGVEGRPPRPVIDTFLATDRGAYRPGDTVHLTALMRDTEAKALPGLPLTAILYRPDGVEYSRHTRTDSLAGGHVFSLPLGTDVPRGTWRLDLKSDLGAEALASQRLLVEDFLPERIDVALSLPDNPLRLGDTPPLTVQADYLFGAPGADLAVEGETRLRRRAALEGYPGYAFGPYDSEFRTRTQYLEAGRTGADGTATLALTLPEVEPESVQGLLLEAATRIRVLEGAGRPVERELVTPLDAQGVRIGLKPAFEDVVPEGTAARFDAIALGEDAVPVRWTVNRIVTRYQWYALYGNWEWEPITRRTRIAVGEATLGEAPTAITAPVDWGRYEIIVETLDGRTITSRDFYAGWYGGGAGTDTPDRLSVSLNADSFAPGDQASLRIDARHAGTALIAVASNRVIARQAVEVSAGENLVPLDVTGDWGAGAYVTVSLLRPMDVAAGQNPARSVGVAYAAIDPGARALQVAIDASETVSGQAGSFDVTVSAQGLTEGDTAYVTLAAVDLGILNLTGFDAPDPQAHYFGQRRLGVEMRDLYGRLIDGLNGEMGRVRSGGDASRGLQRQNPPPTEELMATLVGPVTIGPDGTATVTIQRPAFNGTIRLMAVVWSETGVGQATRDVTARDPVVLTASLPRFLAPGDSSQALIELVHAAGPAGTVALNIDAPTLALGPVPASVELAEKGTARLAIPLSGGLVGDHTMTVSLTTPGGEVLTRTLALGVRQNDPVISTTRRFSLGAGEVFTFDDAVLAGLRSGTASATLSAGPLARFDMPGLLARLDRYPYGCTEQLTSGAMPLLYLSQMAGGMGITGVQNRVDKTIARILTRQSANGAFGLWRIGSGDMWLNAYVTDFLTRARSQGYDVPDRAFDSALDNLLNRVGYAADFDSGGEYIAYALLVLARNGKASMGDLRYYADTKADAFGTPLAVAQVGAALALYGDQLRADRMFAAAAERLRQSQTRGPVWRADYGSNLRDSAALLKLAAEVGSTAVDRSVLGAQITGTARSLSTQEAVQVLLAAHALGSDSAAPSLIVDDTPASGPVAKRRSAGTAPSLVHNISGSPMDVTVTAYGVPEVAPDAGGYGYAITRAYYTMDGARTDAPFTAGERRVAVLTVVPFEEVGARLMIDDALPAGLEIDNPNLIRAGDVRALDWLKPTRTETAEFRADRFLAAVDHRGTDHITLAYIVRAVTPGDYHHPAALVEDMYRPEYRAVTSTGRLTVTQ
ncbi:MAG: alpha-2-macroglobulin family protein [Pseudomonadota bacterium]